MKWVKDWPGYRCWSRWWRDAVNLFLTYQENLM